MITSMYAPNSLLADPVEVSLLVVFGRLRLSLLLTDDLRLRRSAEIPFDVCLLFEPPIITSRQACWEPPFQNDSSTGSCKPRRKATREDACFLHGLCLVPRLPYFFFFCLASLMTSSRDMDLGIILPIRSLRMGLCLVPKLPCVLRDFPDDTQYPGIYN